ncbi:MAG: hypothetical protein ACOYKC_08680 [Anaerolineaceae bacterium]|jgi:hypothetical protein
MSDQNYQNPNDGWNEVPSQAPIPPQQPIPPAQPIPPQPYASDFVEPAPVASEQFVPVEESQQPAPTPPTVPVYDPVKEEQDPYVSVNPTAPAYTSAPSYTDPAPAYQPPEKKKKSGWVIALIIILVLCLCVLIIVGVIAALVASGKYEIQWSYQLLDVLAQFV